MLDEVDEDAQNAALEVPPAALSDRRLLRPALPSISLSPAVVAAGARGRLASALPVGEREGGRWKGAARAGHGEDEAAFLRLACAHGRGPMCCSDALAVAGLPYTRPRDVAARMGGRPGAGVKWWLLVASQSVL